MKRIKTENNYIILRMLRLTMLNQNIWDHARRILSEVREQPTRLFPAEFKYHLLGRTVLTKVRKVILTEAMWANDKLLAPWVFGGKF